MNHRNDRDGGQVINLPIPGQQTLDLTTTGRVTAHICPDHPSIAPTPDPTLPAGAAGLAELVPIGRGAIHRTIALAALYAAGPDGLTDFELERATGVGQTSIGKRRGELVDEDLVTDLHEDTDNGPRPVKRPTPSGRSKAQVWVITAAGRDLIHREIARRNLGAN